MLSLLLAATLLQQQVAPDAPAIMPAFTKDTVEIRQDFSGEEMILFGATHGLTIQDEIVVVLRGPPQDVRVMRRERTFGIWVNSDPHEFADVPSYLAIASSRPLEQFARPDALRHNGIGLQFLLESRPENQDEELREYREAVERTGEREAIYDIDPAGVEILDGGLFRATLALPPSTPVGTYTATVYLFRDGRPIANRPISLTVEKAGLERWIYDFAHDLPLLYGLICVILAMLAGYLAALAFTKR